MKYVKKKIYIYDLYLGWSVHLELDLFLHQPTSLLLSLPLKMSIGSGLAYFKILISWFSILVCNILPSIFGIYSIFFSRYNINFHFSALKIVRMYCKYSKFEDDHGDRFDVISTLWFLYNVLMDTSLKWSWLSFLFYFY